MLPKKKLEAIQASVDEAMIETNMDSDFGVDVELMAQKLGFAVRRLIMNLPDVIALMVIDDMNEEMKRQVGSDKLIALNSSYDEPHLRFAIAHEIGHFFMHRNEPINGTNPVYFANVFTQQKDNEEGIEGEACRFAAMLLMDKRQFKIAYNKLKSIPEAREIDVIRDLAKLFVVPQKAVQRRIEEVAYE